MRNAIPGTAVLALALVGAAAAPAADTFVIDPAHTSVSFKISHMGLSNIHGRFDDVAGQFTIDKDNPARSSFSLTAKIDSIDTNNKKRDEHLRSPDFFNAKQYPLLTFKSTAVKRIRGGYEVTGDLTLHGVTKPITFVLAGGKEAEFPMGMRRTGFTTDLTLKRSAFGMDKFLQMLGDEVQVSIGFQGVVKK
jgi:polyisoprenoid-binding protein YceI